MNLWESEKDKVVERFWRHVWIEEETKGRALVRSLFVGDLDSSPDLNIAERSEWMNLNKLSISVGRAWFFI